jgi:hypothetical protein
LLYSTSCTSVQRHSQHLPVVNFDIKRNISRPVPSYLLPECRSRRRSDRKISRIAAAVGDIPRGISKGQSRWLMISRCTKRWNNGRGNAGHGSVERAEAEATTTRISFGFSNFSLCYCSSASCCVAAQKQRMQEMRRLRWRYWKKSSLTPTSQLSTLRTKSFL